MDTVSRGEATEKELDSLIRRRHDQRATEEAHKPSEDLWAESVRRHHVQRQQELAWAWLRWHQQMLNNHTRTTALITAHHRGEIQKYEELLGINYEGGDAA